MVDSYFHGNPQQKQIYWESTISNFHANPLLKRDEETGFSYFGARHYNPSFSIWLSVDPMSDKYPGVSPYAYCANNPVRLVDPNGEDIWTIDADGKIQREQKIGRAHV